MQGLCRRKGKSVYTSDLVFMLALGFCFILLGLNLFYTYQEYKVSQVKHELQRQGFTCSSKEVQVWLRLRARYQQKKVEVR
jgi:hypothetical protein